MPNFRAFILKLYVGKAVKKHPLTSSPQATLSGLYSIKNMYASFCFSKVRKNGNKLTVFKSN